MRDEMCEAERFADDLADLLVDTVVGARLGRCAPVVDESRLDELLRGRSRRGEERDDASDRRRG